LAISRKKALERGRESIERPKGAMNVVLYHGKGGLTVRYQGKVIARTHASDVGRRLAPYLAESLGAPLPPVGGSVEATVSSGVMYRALSISSVDLRVPEARQLLDYLLEEAEAMRAFTTQQLV